MVEVKPVHTLMRTSRIGNLSTTTVIKFHEEDGQMWCEQYELGRDSSEHLTPMMSKSEARAYYKRMLDKGYKRV